MHKTHENSPLSLDKHLYITHLWGHINLRRKKQLVSLAGLMVVASALEVMSIGAIVPFLSILATPDDFFERQLISTLGNFFKVSSPNEFILILTVVFVTLAFLSSAIRYFLSVLQLRVSYGIGSDLGVEIYRRTLYQPYSVHISRNSNEIVSAISLKTSMVVANTILPLLIITSASIILIVICTTLFFINPIITLIAFSAFLCVYGFAIRLTRRQLAKNSNYINLYTNETFKALQGGLGATRDIILDGTQSLYCNIFEIADKKLRHSQGSVKIISIAPRYFIEAVGLSLFAIFAYILTIRDQGIGASLPVLGALALGVQRLMPNLQQLYQNYSSIKGDQSTLVEVLTLLNQQVSESLVTQSQALPFKSHIKFNGIGFHHDKKKEIILRNIDVTIPKGSRVGIFGATGSGKSTLLDIFMGLLIPTEGYISVDDCRVNHDNYAAWRINISHVPQAIFLTDATITENIAFGVPIDKIDHEKVRSAACQAQISNVIESWSLQYETLVGERGVRLSGGQKQRIGIARALYKSSDIIVFDEATSALDIDTELAVMREIESLNRQVTIVIVTHRLTTLQNCDFLIKLDKGKVAGIGSYAQLLEKQI